jgi:hypothetical protein
MIRNKDKVQNMYTFSEELLSDLHKDARGSRPRSDAFWTAWADADDQGKQAIWDGLVQEMEIADQEERESEQQSIVEFEDVVQEYISHGAQDRATALRWLVRDDMFEPRFYQKQDIESWVYDQGFLFTDEGRALVVELAATMRETYVLAAE